MRLDPDYISIRGESVSVCAVCCVQEKRMDRTISWETLKILSGNEGKEID